MQRFSLEQDCEVQKEFLIEAVGNHDSFVNLCFSFLPCIISYCKLADTLADVPLSISLSSIPSAGEGSSTIGCYSPSSRRKRILKFQEKRKQRVWTKKVKYDVRKVSNAIF